MVHALKEAGRILDRDGILIDLRPICFDTPLEIVTATGCESTDLLDMSLGIAHDIAADNATHMILTDGDFIRRNVQYFDAAYYWNTVTEMEAYINENWKDDVFFPEGVLKQARLLFDQNGDRAQVRIKVRMKLGKYEKQ